MLWVKEGYSVRQLVNISKHGIWKIKQIKKHWLDNTPQKMDWNFKEIKYLLFDGTYFQHKNCLMILMDSLNGTTIDFRYHIRENFKTAYEIFANLKAKGLYPKAITIDGNTTVIMAIEAVWPHILIQRCLTHIQRQGLSWLRRFPKTDAAKQLRNILLATTNIKNIKDKKVFIARFNNWELSYGSYVQSLSSKDKVFSDLQRTRSLIIHAIPNMFYYLKDKNITSTTNKIEGYFSRFKDIYKRHRGLSKDHRISFINWYIFFKNIS